MADTFTPVQGFLAGIYRAVGLTIGATTVYQPLTNPAFEAGSLAGWTDDSTPASTAVATVNKGWGDKYYGCVLTDDGTNKAGISQIVTLDAAVNAAQAAKWRVHASCWAKFYAASKEATLKVTCLSVADADLGNGSVTLISQHPFYDADGTYGEWGYFSISINAVENTKKLKIEIYSNAALAQVVDIDRATLVVLEQLGGAVGPMGLPQGHVLKESTTYATADDGFRSFHPTLKKAGEMTLPAYWVLADSFGTEMRADTQLFFVLWSQKGTKTSDRYEFWGHINGIEWSAAPEELQHADVSVTADGLIGFADR
ncbi:MAG: hypothetical protein WC565_09595 [Parcubacteria group bacterium]|jgi:hypothetical protein